MFKIGSKVLIKNKDSMYYNEWGTIIFYDGDYYHVAIADGKDSVPIFDKDELKIMRG